MKRTTLTLPERFTFSTEMRCRITDVNYGGHVGYDSLVAFFHEARVRFLESHGWSESDIEGASLMMIDAVIVCVKEIFAGQPLCIDLAVDDISRTGFNCFYRLSIDGNEHARAKTGMIFFDYTKKQIARTPEAFIQAVRDAS